ncbi:RNA polymerase sigma factor [Actinomadura sp. K4S16]|uniref:RNA polymerase sigma factor n=1 Tax=Actinomadura sp. K4S16 TaxID=1316147 RepID=UPI001F2172F8|nr:RNA polymerase sigma factor [Actinomadura sp. K4S16]
MTDGVSAAEAVPEVREDADAEVIAASQREPDRFTEIFDRYYPEIHRYVDRRLGADAADDIASETFLVAFRKRARYDSGQGPARAWLYGIATRLVSRHRRGEVRRYRALARAADRGAGAATHESHEERVASQVTAAGVGGRLGAALASLSPGDRDVLLLVALADLTYPEVAQALGVKYGTVCSRLSRARKKVSAALGGADPTRHTDREGA